MNIRFSTPSRRIRFLILIPLAIFFLALALWKQHRSKERSQDQHSLRDMVAAQASLRIDDVPAFFQQAQLIELLPPILLPGRASEKLKTQIFIRLPSDAHIELVSKKSRQEMNYPVGTWVARVESVRRKGAAGSVWSVVDVRATRFEADGQHFEVYRPESQKVHAPLIGITWLRDDQAAQKMADDWIAQAATLSVSAKRQQAASKKARADNNCSACHRMFREDVVGQAKAGSLHRGTDAAGLFVPRTLLKLDAPLEAYAKRELNLAQPFVKITCAKGPQQVILPTNSPDSVKCKNRDVPQAQLQEKAGLAALDPHTVANCRSRAELFKALNKSAKQSFSLAFADCLDFLNSKKSQD